MIMSHMENIIADGFWVCAAAVFYVYAGYPMIICALALLWKKQQAEIAHRGPPKSFAADCRPQ
jgi:hypothetical protein